MRDILFKAKRVDNGEWVEGNLFVDDKGIKHEILIGYVNYRIAWEVDKDTICQYTGLTDKNGQRIWENDIFKFDDEVWSSSYTSCGTEYDSWDVENYAVVGFDVENARYDFIKYKFNENSVEADLHENHDLEFADFVGKLEVIGNIFDNPELVKE